MTVFRFSNFLTDNEHFYKEISLLYWRKCEYIKIYTSNRVFSTPVGTKYWTGRPPFGHTTLTWHTWQITGAVMTVQEGKATQKKCPNKSITEFRSAHNHIINWLLIGQDILRSPMVKRILVISTFCHENCRSIIHKENVISPWKKEGIGGYSFCSAPFKRQLFYLLLSYSSIFHRFL